MSEVKGGVKLTLTHQPKPNESENGLSALFERLSRSDGRQLLILAVVPVATTTRRYDAGKVTTVEIRAIEPMIDDRDRDACQSLMEAAARLRLGREPKAPDAPPDMLTELDEAFRQQGKVPMAGRDFDIDGDAWPDSATVEAQAAGAYDDI